MEVIIQPNQEAAAALVGRIVARELRANPQLVLGLATGQTMECVYRHLVRLHQTAKLDFSLCRTFNLDEYVGLFPADPNSYRHYMNQHLFRHVNIDPRNTYLPNGLATDLDEECRRCILLATGASKAKVIAQAVEGPITSMISATALQLHARSTVIVDEEAAGNLIEKDYYRWIFTNEPEWEEYR